MSDPVIPEAQDNWTRVRRFRDVGYVFRDPEDPSFKKELLRLTSK